MTFININYIGAGGKQCPSVTNHGLGVIWTIIILKGSIDKRKNYYCRWALLGQHQGHLNCILRPSPSPDTDQNAQQATSCLYKPGKAWESIFKPVQACSSVFKPVQARSSLLKPVQACSSLFKHGQAYPRLYKPGQRSTTVEKQSTTIKTVKTVKQKTS